jgi:hypothetical protein
MERIAFLLFVILPLVTSAQKYTGHIHVLEGSVKDLKTLKGQTSYNLVYRYDDMIVGNEAPEAAYLAKKKKDQDFKYPGSGNGAKFEKMWFAARKDMYEPTFTRNFPTFAKTKVGDAGAKYTLILKTTRTEGGWDGGVVRKPAEIDLELWIVETADNSKVLVKIEFLNVNGMKSHGSDFEMVERIQDAYLYASKIIGDYFAQKTE